MRTLFLLFLLALSASFANGQKISYGIPAGYEQAISAEDYKKLVDGAVARVQRRYAVDSVGGGTILLHPGQDLQAFNLHNMIGPYVSRLGRKKRSQLLAAHFDQLFASIDAQKRINPFQFDSVRHQLSIRIFPKAFIDGRGGADSLVVRADVEGSLTVLMLDLDGTLVPVQRGLLRQWHQEEEAAFAVAEENVRAQQLQLQASLATGQEAVDLALINDADYAARYGLNFDLQSPELVGEMGSVVAIPPAGAISIYRIARNKPVDYVTFIQRSAQLDAQYQGRPPTAGNRYFWYFKGKFTPIEVTTDEHGAISVTAPNELSQLMTAFN